MNGLREILEKRGCHYEIIRHEKPILSREDGARYFGIDAGRTAPSLVLKTDKGYFVLIVSGSRGRLDFDNIAGLLGCEKVKLASPKEVREATGFEAGCVPLVGLDLPCVLDKRLLRYDFVNGGTGQPTCTLKIKPQALKRLNQVVATLDE